MKGLIVKRGDNICKVGIPDSGVCLMANVTRYDGAFWSVGGLRMPGEIHVTWNGGMLQVGEEIEVKFAEFDEATPPVAEESHQSVLEAAAARTDDDPEIWNRQLDTYYRLKKYWRMNTLYRRSD